MVRGLRVGVIFGGRSGEHEVSLKSARTIIEALDRDRYEVVPIGITKEGRWLLGGDPLRALVDGVLVERAAGAVGGVETRRTLTPALGVAPLDGQGLDVVFPALHGTYGEDGTVQGLLELAQIPYVGCGVLASAAGMDKAVMKDLFRQRGIPVIDALVVRRSRWRRQPEEVIAEAERRAGYPCFVKPANLGSSVGISKARDRCELASALHEAAQYDRKLIVEKALEGCREIEVGVLGNDDPIVSVPGEVVTQHEFYDYDAKYTAGGSEFIIPANLPPAMTSEVQRLAIAAFEALDCAGLARIDCFAAKGGEQVFVNEVNTIPGFTPTSMFHRLWEASGIGIAELLERLIALAIERHADVTSSRRSYC